MTLQQKMQAAVEATLVQLQEMRPHTEAPQETVTLAVWATSDGAVALVTPGTRCDHPDHPLDRRLGTVTLPLDRERGE